MAKQEETSGLPALLSQGSPLWRAFKKGRPAEALLDAAMAMLEQSGVAEDQRARLAALHIASLAIKVRQQDVAVVGDREAFVRRTPDGGELVQVVRPVTLSLPDEDLYQIQKTAWVPKAEAAAKGLTILDEWRGGGAKAGKVKVPMTLATPLMKGVHVLNGVVGLSCAETPNVAVDGQRGLPNPYIQRTTFPADDPLLAGCVGDLQRVVIRVAVIGATPGTGNMVAVQYTLDHEPRHTLLAMLAELASGENKWGDQIGGNIVDNCYLTTVRQARRLLETEGYERWEFVHQVGGTGYLVNVGHPAVLAKWTDYEAVLDQVIKKAQTVARRNAMMHHPALGQYRTVTVDRNGLAKLAVTGWAGGVGGMGWYLRAAERIAQGAPLPTEAFEVIEVHEDDAGAGTTEDDDGMDQSMGAARPVPYEVQAQQGTPQEPTQGAAGGANDGEGAPTPEDTSQAPQGHDVEPEPGPEPGPEPEPEPPAVVLMPDQRRELVAYLDQQIQQGDLTPLEVRSLAYDPATNTDAELINIKTAVDRMTSTS